MGKVNSVIYKDDPEFEKKLENFRPSKDAVKKVLEQIHPGEGEPISEDELPQHEYFCCSYWMSPVGEFLKVGLVMSHCEYVIANYSKFGYLSVDEIIRLLGIKRDVDVNELFLYDDDGIINKDVLARGWVKISYSRHGITIITLKKSNEWLTILKTVLAHLFLAHSISKSAMVDIEFCKPDGAWDYGAKYSVGKLLESCRRHKMTGVDEEGK